MTPACKTEFLASNQHTRDRELVEACIAGRSDAWRRFVRQYDRQFRYVVANACQSFMLSTHDREDIVGHVYEKLLERDCRRLRAWRAECSLITFMTVVVRRLALDYVRGHIRGRHMQRDEDIRDLADKLADSDSPELRPEVLDLRGALEDLPPRQAAILRLRLQGVSMRAIAGILGIPEGTVFSESRRAMLALRDLLTDYDASRADVEELS
jgi:RNA polymerase sigma factor (sigma-70 family)